MDNSNETVRELCAEIGYWDDEVGKDHPIARPNEVLGQTMVKLRWWRDRILATYEREIAAKDAEIESALKKQNDYHAALLTICTADKDAEGLREIAIDACNDKEVK